MHQGGRAQNCNCMHGLNAYKRCTRADRAHDWLCVQVTRSAMGQTGLTEQGFICIFNVFGVPWGGQGKDSFEVFSASGVP